MYHKGCERAQSQFNNNNLYPSKCQIENRKFIIIHFVHSNAKFQPFSKYTMADGYNECMFFPGRKDFFANRLRVFQMQITK